MENEREGGAERAEKESGEGGERKSCLEKRRGRGREEVEVEKGSRDARKRERERERKGESKQFQVPSLLSSLLSSLQKPAQGILSPPSLRRSLSLSLCPPFGYRRCRASRSRSRSRKKKLDDVAVSFLLLTFFFLVVARVASRGAALSPGLSSLSFALSISPLDSHLSSPQAGAAAKGLLESTPGNAKKNTSSIQLTPMPSPPPPSSSSPRAAAVAPPTRSSHSTNEDDAPLLQSKFVLSFFFSPSHGNKTETDQREENNASFATSFHSLSLSPSPSPPLSRSPLLLLSRGARGDCQPGEPERGRDAKKALEEIERSVGIRPPFFSSSFLLSSFFFFRPRRRSTSSTSPPLCSPKHQQLPPPRRPPPATAMQLQSPRRRLSSGRPPSSASCGIIMAGERISKALL